MKFYINVQCIRLAAGQRTQAGDATDRAINETLRQFARLSDISQGSVATHFMGGIFGDSIITNFLLILAVK